MRRSRRREHAASARRRICRRSRADLVSEVFRVGPGAEGHLDIRADDEWVVADLRERKGRGYKIPCFDPMDGGVEAECLFLLEAPGPNAVKSGFIFRNNPDETAKNFFQLNLEAGIDRRRTVSWNLIPWYIGTGKRIRAASAADRREAEPVLAQLLSLLPRLRAVVLIGNHARKAQAAIANLVPTARIFLMPHPSPMFVNRAPANRNRIAACLPKSPHTSHTKFAMSNGLDELQFVVAWTLVNWQPIPVAGFKRRAARWLH